MRTDDQPGQNAMQPHDPGRVTRRGALLGATAALPAMAPRAAAASRSDLQGPQATIPVDMFIDGNAADETEAVQRAIAAARRFGGALMFSARTYRIGGTLDLPSGIQLIGAGAVAGAGPDEVAGTVLRRISDCVMLRMAGQSFRNGGPMRHSLQLRGMLFDGGDFTSDLAQFVAVSRVTINDCFFLRSRGRHLLLHEVFDSRIGNTDFDGGGRSGGGGKSGGGMAALAPPAVELRSGDGYEYTNHVHFTGCRLESYPGTAIALTGGNTNKIYLTDCKLESLASNQPALTAIGAVALHLAGVQITARGEVGATLDSLLSIQDSSFIVGDLILEHVAWDGGATLGAYVSLETCRGVDLQLSVIDGQNVLPLGSYVRIGGSEACSVRGIFRRGRHVEERSWVA